MVFLTDENCRVAATVKGLNNVRGILMGARSSVRESPDLRLRFLKPEPVLEPGQSFEYTSACPLGTAFGTMHGSYQMVVASDEEFDAEIAPFTLAAPNAVQ